MCGRIALYTPPLRMARLLDATLAAGLDPERPPSWNVGPTRTLLAMTEPADDAGRHRVLDEYRWGLIPPWANDPSVGNRLFNARAETLADKPSFRSAYGARRLAIPVDGFYEWHKTPGGSRQPYFFRRADGAPVVFAGLYEFWRDPTFPDGEHPWVRSCTIITTAAGEDMAAIHDRMPAILESDAFDAWLDPDAERPVLDGLLLPAAGGTLARVAVDRGVGNVANDGPGLIDEAAADREEPATLF
jgi:putative SOS response-associated peptidase YedK